MEPLQIFDFNEDKYVWSKDLHRALDLADSNYSKNVEGWLNNDYLFLGKYDFSKPVRNYDYFLEGDIGRSAQLSSPFKTIGSLIPSFSGQSETVEKRRGNFSTNYLLRLEFSKLIALDSNSKQKKVYVQWLLSLEARLEKYQLISQQALLGLMEMVKMCSYIDNQLQYYKTHKNKYFEEKDADDSWKDFDRFRNSIMQIMDERQIDNVYSDMFNSTPKTKLTKIEKLAIIDSLESVRSSLFDFLTQQLTPYTFSNISRAKDLANLVQKMFDAAGVHKIDIKGRGETTTSQLNLFYKVEDINLRLIQQTVNELRR